MKSFASKVEEGREGSNGKLSVGPVYRNLLSKHRFPPTDPRLTTAWDIFRYIDCGRSCSYIRLLKPLY